MTDEGRMAEAETMTTRAPVESGDPVADRAGFRRTLGEFATGVAVITTRVDGISYGLTSNSFASVSLDPPLVLWSIRRESQSFGIFERCTGFVVNVLADHQIDLSQRFAKSGADKFVGVRHRPGQRDQHPLLDGVAAHLECRTRDLIDGGDHVILLGEVVAFARFEHQPLIFSKGRYGVTNPHPASDPAATSRPARDVADGEVLSNLMIRAYTRLASEIELARREAGLGLSVMQARLLRAAAANLGATLEELLPELMLDFNASQSVLSSLVALGLLVCDEQQRIQTTSEGKDRVGAVIASARRCETAIFGSVPQDHLAVTKSVLSRFLESRPPSS